jgi:biofilm PGA synthesis N-glycosyltransferase PgaC
LLAVIILAILACYVIGTHLSYPIVLRILARRHKKSYSIIGTLGVSKLSTSHLPLVSVIVPVYNEESVIERRINNILESAYPKDKIETIIVDSGSNDRTGKIVSEKFHNQVTLKQEEQRKGKAHAINMALRIARGEIVLLTDGPALFEKETIFQIVKSFQDPAIGGVSVLYKIPNAKDNLLTNYENEILSYKDEIRVLESRLYATSWLSGEACAFRNKTISYVHEDTLADDSNIALQLISKGYRVIVNENSNFNEKSPSEVYDYYRIKTRRVMGGLREMFRFRSLLFNPQYGYFGSIIFPYRFFAQLICPIASLVALILIFPALFEISSFLNLNVILVSTILATLFVLSFFMRDKIMPYMITQSIMLTAFFLLLLNKVDVKWAQSKTTRV